MPRYVALLRAINVGGHTVAMDRLRKLFESLGLANVETFIASGNVIFESRAAGALNVAFLAAAPGPGARRALEGLKTAIDDFHLNGRELYWMCRKKQSESRFSNVVLERSLELRATFRGINTVRKLAEKYPAG